MWWSYIANVFMGTIMLITMLFCIGDLDTAIESDAPFLVLFTNTGSTAVALLLSVILFVLVFAGNITALATTSRELWAFSRDRGFPFSKWISKVSLRRPIEPTFAAILIQYTPPDELQMECPYQFRIPRLHYLRSILLDQSRLYIWLQHHRLPRLTRPTLHVYALHRVRAPQTHLARATTSRTLEPRPTGTTDQCIRILLFLFRHRLCRLP